MRGKEQERIESHVEMAKALGKLEDDPKEIKKRAILFQQYARNKKLPDNTFDQESPLAKAMMTSLKISWPALEGTLIGSRIADTPGLNASALTWSLTFFSPIIEGRKPVRSAGEELSDEFSSFRKNALHFRTQQALAEALLKRIDFENESEKKKTHKTLASSIGQYEQRIAIPQSLFMARMENLARDQKDDEILNRFRELEKRWTAAQIEKTVLLPELEKADALREAFGLLKKASESPFPFINFLGRFLLQQCAKSSYRSIQDFSASLNLNASSMSLYIAGKGFPEAKAFTKMAKNLGNYRIPLEAAVTAGMTSPYSEIAGINLQEVLTHAERIS